MNEKLDLEIQYTVDDYARSLTFIQNRQFFVKYAFIIVPLLLLFFLGFLFLLNPDGITEILSEYAIFAFVYISAIFVLFLLFKYVPSPFLRWNMTRQFNSSPLLREIQQITFDEIGINGQNQLSAGTIKWNAIIEATESKDDFFFFTSNKCAMFVPKNNLALEQLNQIKEFATENLGEKAKF